MDLNEEIREEWRPVKGFEKRYAVSNHGRVKRIAGTVNRKGGGAMFFKETILKQGTHRKGYKLVYLSKKSKKTTAKVHRLVAQAFISNPENKRQVNHIDYDKTNNCADNLEWCTNKENAYHAIENGASKLTTKKGSKNGQSILTESKVKEIRSKYIPNIYTRQMLADEFNVSLATIKDVVQKRSWRHVI